MDIYNIIITKLFENTEGIAKYSDFISAGLKPAEITKLCKKGDIVRIRHGYYQLPDNGLITEARMLKKMIPEAVISVESALFYYGYSDFTPRKWTVTVPRNVARTKLDTCTVPIQVYYTLPELYQIGMSTGSFDDVELPLYDRERTICDCFKFRSRLDSELFNKAVNAYVKDEKKNLVNLTEYAKKLHVYNKLIEIMEVLLNG